jgi:hypothetical protein
VARSQRQLILMYTACAAKSLGSVSTSDRSTNLVESVGTRRLIVWRGAPVVVVAALRNAQRPNAQRPTPQRPNAWTEDNSRATNSPFPVSYRRAIGHAYRGRDSSKSSL